MVYLECFEFPSDDDEWKFFMHNEESCYDNYYPFQVFSRGRLERLDFEPITILSGSNGSGKTTALNVIAETLKLPRDSVFNRSNFYNDYIELCKPYYSKPLPKNSRIITSDDVFDYMINLRNINSGVDSDREAYFEEYRELVASGKYRDFKMRSMADYDTLKKLVDARKSTTASYIKRRSLSSARSHSNGESAFRYFSEKITDSGLYLLDEPENSLSVEKQLELVSFIEDSARYFGCQFIISTHSVFLMSLRSAKIYDFDENPVDVKRWSDLKTVRAYYDFFRSHEYDFEL